MARAQFRIQSDGATDPGRVRALNEDSFLMRPEIGLWVVADGMGGHDAGDFASQTVIDEIAKIGRPKTAPGLLAAFEDGVLAANRILRAAAESRGPKAVVGCTLAALVIFEEAFAGIWSGDSRIYRVRAGKPEQLSRDHTEVQELVDRGALTPEEARTSPRRNVITRAIGARDQPELEMVQGRLEDGDAFVICSDGLTEHVEDHEIGQAAMERPLSVAVERLMSTTLERGARDNVTVIVVSCREVTAVHDGVARTEEEFR